MNKVIVAGRLAKEVEVRILPSGQAAARVPIAINEFFKDKSGEWKERTSYVDIEVYGSLAERLTRLNKGDKILLEGKIRQDLFEDKEGKVREKVKIIANRIQLLAKPKAKNNNQKETNNKEIDIEDII